MKVQRSLLGPCLLALALAQLSSAAHNPRQLANTTPTPSQPPPTNNIPQTPNPGTTQQQQPPPPLSNPNQQTTTPPTTNNVPTVTPPVLSTPTVTPSLSTPLATSNIPTSVPALPSLPLTTEEAITTTGADGEAITVTVTSSPVTSSPTATPSKTPTKEDDDGGGLSTGSIVGMSVAAGVAVIGIVGFFIWKFTRKRFSDFDDNEAIKWPELNSHSAGGPDTLPLPTRDTGRAGFDTGSEADLSRVNSVSNYSTPDLGAGGPDPYAIPPLPHLNPNQPYQDDPSAPLGYYDPYRGPVPGTIENGGSDWHPEAYPMTQLGGPAGRASPAPDYVGRQSPAPHGMYAGRSSPAPQAAYGGRGSPGPQAAYSTGRMSPGPNTAYDAYGAR